MSVSTERRLLKFQELLTMVSNPTGTVGELFFNTTDDKLYVWNGSACGGSLTLMVTPIPDQ